MYHRDMTLELNYFAQADENGEMNSRIHIAPTIGHHQSGSLCGLAIMTSDSLWLGTQISDKLAHLTCKRCARKAY